MKTSALYLNILVGFILMLTASIASAQNMVGDLDEKFHLEKSISERLEQTLKTRLEKSYFDITVEAHIKRKGVNVKVKEHASETASTEELQNWYANQVRSMSRQIAKADGMDAVRPYELESLVVTLGLSDQVEPAYREELKTWLKTWVATDFGPKGEANVLVRPSNMVQKNDSVGGGLSRYQNLLGMVFLGLIFGSAFFMHSRRQRQQPQTAAMVPTETMAPKNTVPQLVHEDNIHKEQIRTLKNKIAWVSPGMKVQVDALMAKWCHKEVQSYLKVAAFLEALAEGGASLPEGSRATIPAFPNYVQTALPKALTHLQELESSMELSLYQEIYSELLSGGSMTIEARSSEYDFMANLSDTEFLKMFDSMNESFKVALLTRMPAEQRRRYSDLVEPEKLRRLLNYSLVCQEPTEEELREKLSAWKGAGEPDKSTAPNMNMKFAKLREVWSVFSRLEETLWLHHIISIHPELKESLMNEGPHLAFMAEWPTEMIRKFCLGTKTRELAAAAKALPFLSAHILNSCGEVTRKEIQNEMLQMEEPRLSQYFDNFVTSFDQFVDTEKNGVHTLIKENMKGVA